MQIANILTGYRDAVMLGKRGQASEPGKTGKTDDAAATPSALQPTAPVADILARYDVRDITPADFAEMIQALYDAGALSEQEWQQLAAVRVDLEQAGTDPDDSIDLVEFYVDRITRLQRGWDRGDSSLPIEVQLAALRRRLDWVEKFALIQSAPESLGLDALA